MRSANEQRLIQIVDAAMVEAARKSGNWLACRPGCCECCMGVFPIRQSDVRRLREGLRELVRTDPERAADVLSRARDASVRYGGDFPGNPVTGILGEDAESEERFEFFGNDDPCPALDPATGTCDLYEYRPMTCRTFGPAVRINADAVGACELCYQGATDEEIVACRVEVEISDIDAAVEREAERETGLSGRTIIAFALRW